MYARTVSGGVVSLTQSILPHSSHNRFSQQCPISWGMVTVWRNRYLKALIWKEAISHNEISVYLKINQLLQEPNEMLSDYTLVNDRSPAGAQRQEYSDLWDQQQPQKHKKHPKYNFLHNLIFMINSFVMFHHSSQFKAASITTRQKQQNERALICKMQWVEDPQPNFNFLIKTNITHE